MLLPFYSFKLNGRYKTFLPSYLWLTKNSVNELKSLNCCSNFSVYDPSWTFSFKYKLIALFDMNFELCFSKRVLMRSTFVVKSSLFLYTSKILLFASTSVLVSPKIEIPPSRMNTMTVSTVPYLKPLYKNLNNLDFGCIVRFDAGFS